MIKPTTLWGLFKSCDDSAWLGAICRALGGQDVQLDYGQRQMCATIRLDSGWMDERIEARREKWREQKRNQRGQFASDGDGNGEPVENADNAEMSAMSVNVQCPQMSAAIHTSLPPSIDNNNTYTRAHAKCGRIPTDEEQVMYAGQMGVPLDYLKIFRETMRARDWSYTNRGGILVYVGINNLKTTLQSFYETYKKEQNGTHPHPPAPRGRRADNHLDGKPDPARTF